MKAKIFLFFCFLVILFSCKKEPTSYLDQWLGEYEGTSSHWISVGLDIYHKENKKVYVNVQKSSIDSSLNLTIIYDDSINGSNNDLKFTYSGYHVSSWGGGSSGGYLRVNFGTDSLHYSLVQACGIPCQKGINFHLNKK